MSYQLELSRTALKGLAAIPPNMRRRLADSISALADDPRPPASRQLQGEPQGFRRLRVGDYSIIYHYDTESRVVTVLRVAPRGRVYR